MSQQLTEEFKYYCEHQNDLAKQYDGKFLVIVGNEIVGVFDNELEAYFETEKQRPVGTFLIQHCRSGKESHTETFHSRIAFK